MEIVQYCRHISLLAAFCFCCGNNDSTATGGNAATGMISITVLLFTRIDVTGKYFSSFSLPYERVSFVNSYSDRSNFNFSYASFSSIPTAKFTGIFRVFPLQHKDGDNLEHQVHFFSFENEFLCMPPASFYASRIHQN